MGQTCVLVARWAKLLFRSWVRGGAPGIDKLWVLGIQPICGSLDTTQLPLPAAFTALRGRPGRPTGKIALECAKAQSRSLDRPRRWYAWQLLDYKRRRTMDLFWTPDGKTIIIAVLPETSCSFLDTSRR